MSKTLVTGCAGFIGGHLIKRSLEAGNETWGLDDLSRPGSTANLTWLHQRFGDKFRFRQGDVADSAFLEEVFREAGSFERIAHQAGQVAVTTSVSNPALDFHSNALGTFSLLEATRLHSPEAGFLFASTNKVYGESQGQTVYESTTRHDFEEDDPGISEKAPLDFHSPYGCSKGAADQYVRDYARIYGLRTTVFRQSCIYGTRQFGIEDQGWVAWFTLAAMLREPVTIYGNGKQIRDVLWIDDLCDLYFRAWEHPEAAAGKIFNVGGGKTHRLSLLELLTLLKEYIPDLPEPSYENWRPGDQKVYFSDLANVRDALNWEPSTTPAKGIEKLVEWAKGNLHEIRKVLGKG